MNAVAVALNEGTISAPQNGNHHSYGVAHGSNGANPAVVLTSWKEIARYMGKGVRTVQRWEQDFGLPVRRPRGSDKKAVLARPRDLDAWVAMRCSSRSEGSGDHDPATLSVDALSRLACGIETSSVLRHNNQALLNEVAASLEALRQQVLTFSNSRSCAETARAA